MIETPHPSWPALDLARRHDPRQRVPVRVDTPEGPRTLGSVARDDLAALAAWPQHFERAGEQLVLRVPPDLRQVVLAEVHQALRAQGRIRAWRDEPYPWLDDAGRLLAVIERAASRFWGSLTFGAHCNGYVADGAGRPSHLWVATRSLDKPTDPGKQDNLIGGGVPHGQTPRQALLREAWEEAGLSPAQLAGLQAGSVLGLRCDVPEGLQQEWLFVYDLALPAGLVPQNQDGEVAEHRLLPIDAALDCAAEGHMTTDAALATLDLAVRHRLLPAAEARGLAQRLDALRVPPQLAARIDPPAS